MNNHVYSPFFIDYIYGVAYTYNEQEGLKPLHHSRRMLRARSILASAFMCASIRHTVIGGYLIYGDKKAINAFDMDIFNISTTFPILDAVATTEHAGYYALPDDEQAGWRSYPGWAVTFLNDVSPEHRMFEIYQMVQHSITYLGRNPEILGNILTARSGIRTASSV